MFYLVKILESWEKMSLYDRIIIFGFDDWISLMK